MLTRTLAIALANLALAFSVTSCAAESTAEPVKHVLLDDSYAPLRDAFNAARGSVRLIFVVDSACPVCLRGMADIDQDLLAETRDPRLRTYVVHVPVIGGEPDDIAPSAVLLHNPHVTHYWNESSEFGNVLTRAYGLKKDDEDVYAWDVWMIYGPDADWSGVAPPKPELLMHQLPALRGNPAFPMLDSAVFASRARAMLAALPAAASTQ